MMSSDGCLRKKRGRVLQCEAEHKKYWRCHGRNGKLMEPAIG